MSQPEWWSIFSSDSESSPDLHSDSRFPAYFRSWSYKIRSDLPYLSHRRWIRSGWCQVSVPAATRCTHMETWSNTFLRWLWWNCRDTVYLFHCCKRTGKGFFDCPPDTQNWYLHLLTDMQPLLFPDRWWFRYHTGNQCSPACTGRDPPDSRSAPPPALPSLSEYPKPDFLLRFPSPDFPPAERPPPYLHRKSWHRLMPELPHQTLLHSLLQCGSLHSLFLYLPFHRFVSGTLTCIWPAHWLRFHLTW